MKTISRIIIASVLALQMNVLVAGNECTSTPTTNESANTALISVAPTTPMEATFENDTNDIADPTGHTQLTRAIIGIDNPNDAISFDIETLAPATPAEAGFDVV